MNSNNMINHNKDRTKGIAAIPMVGAIATASLLLLSGLSLLSSYQPAMAQQQNMTTGGAGGEGGTTGGGNATTGGATQGGNATTSTAGGAGGGNDSISRIRMHVEEARAALQNNDTQGAMMQLDLIDNALGGAGVLEANNTTGTTAGGATTNMTTGGGTEGGAATNATTGGGTEGGTTGGG
jgi:hypothetical protein